MKKTPDFFTKPNHKKYPFMNFNYPAAGKIIIQNF
ncbi:MAG: hypothetical protein MW689_001176 [Thermodesulfobacteria bacterium]|nr:hypothetical protein [Thermodesulfobacteriota bacterium]